MNKATLFAGTLTLAFTERGRGDTTYLLLHGGAGPGSMAVLAESLPGRVVLPTHPGFEGTARPAWLARPADLVLAYLALLDELEGQNVVVVGNSFGGWLAAELGLRGSSRIAKIALLNAVGIAPGDTPIVDPARLAPAERAAYAFHDLQHARALGTPHLAANQDALRVYAGEPFMHDPSLAARLGALEVPALVLWGESDRIVDVGYGRRFAASMPAARFEVVPGAGHFPHVEQRAHVAARLAAF